MEDSVANAPVSADIDMEDIPFKNLLNDDGYEISSEESDDRM